MRPPSIDPAPRSAKVRIAAALVLYLAAGAIAGCAPAPLVRPAAPTPPPPPVSDLVSATALDAAAWLLQAERAAAQSGDLNMLAQLWAEDALVVDGRTTSDAGDDYRWQGRAAVLDRYVLAVFPNPPPDLVLPDPLPIRQPSAAEMTLILGIDRWRFTFDRGRWWLAELRYQ